MSEHRPPIDSSFWGRIILTLICSMLSAAFGAGVAMATVNGRLTFLEYRVGQTETTIVQIQARTDKIGSDVAGIDTHLATIEANLEAIKQTLAERKDGR